LASSTDVTKIKSISFEKGSERNFDNFLSVVKLCQNLEELTIGYGMGISQTSFEKLLVILQSMIHLKGLYLSGFTKTVFKISHFQSLSCLSSLEDLSLAFIFDFKDDSCDFSALKSLKSLKLVYLNTESEIYLPKGLGSIANTLESLDVIIKYSKRVCNMNKLYSLYHLKSLKTNNCSIPLNDEQIQAIFPKLKCFSCKRQKK